MPRNPGARKNQHNNRHENGLVGPGKRIVKQRSSQQLNGSATKPPTPPESVIDSSTVVNGVPSSPVIPRHDDSSSRAQDSETDGPYLENAKKHEAANAYPMAAQRSVKHKSGHDVSALQIANTILKSRPACDTIALLIVLLALPSMILTIVQALFASLTMMPGAGPLSLASVIDIFQFAQGGPSLGTMAWVDGVCFLLWVCLWNWAQNFALDLAQIHIAITLGNGSSGKSSSANTICFGLVLVLHTIRSRGVRRFILSNLIPTSLLSQTHLAEFQHYLPSDADFGDTPGSPSKLRSLFAIHILSQALVSFIRRQLANSQAGSASKSSKRLDAEATGAPSLEVNGIDGSASASLASGNDYQGPSPMLRDAKDKGVTAKKRRRQANHVRSRQPFWAALASTKVHVLREVENKKGLPNVTTTNDGYAELPQSDNVWIRNVDPSSIHVEARFSAFLSDEGDPDSSTPLFVRINGAKWQSVHIYNVQDENAVGNWIVEINGLAPNCTYTCTFHDAENGEEFASVMVRTPILVDKDYPSTMVSTPVRESTRPQSPTTTLKNSIASEEGKLAEARRRLAQLKKQHKAALNKTDREVDSLNGRLKSGGDDNKLRQKLLQTERQIRQTEDNTTTLVSTLETLETVPEDETLEWNNRKAAFEEQKRLLADATEALSKAKAAADSELTCQHTELSSAVTRHERLTSRVTKLNEQHDRITQANAEGMNEKERREAESAARQQEHLRKEKELITNIGNLNTQLYDVQMQTNNHWREIEILDKQDQLNRSKMLLQNGPLTPEGEIPGMRNQAQHPRAYGFGGFSNFSGPVEVQESPFLPYASTLPTETRRPRSGTNRSLGALSNFSEDFEDADPIPPTLQENANGRKGSGSSRGKNNGSPAHGFMGSIRSPGRHSPGHMPGTTTCFFHRHDVCVIRVLYLINRKCQGRDFGGGKICDSSESISIYFEQPAAPPHPSTTSFCMRLSLQLRSFTVRHVFTQRCTLPVATKPRSLRRNHSSTTDMGKKQAQELIKNPKGTRDWSGEDVDILEDILAQISGVFRKHGGKKLDTPVFEREEVLKGKYGEDSKLIYDLKDQGGELLSLRYDLTVPFARWLAMNSNVRSYRRFAISKVYRRDQPAIAKGRMREFYQCDIDFAGASDPMIADSEVIAIVVEVFETLGWTGKYTIKLNDRRILDGMFEVCGVPQDKIRTISSAVDKLDKAPWSEVRQEMVETKGLDPEVADKIQTYVVHKGGKDLLERLQKDEALMANPKAKLGVEEMSTLFSYLEAWGALDKISFDLSLARGLDYYTGVIYEVVTEGSAPVTANVSTNGTAEEASKQGKKEKKQLAEDEDRSNDPSVGIGSVAAGGRYDNLVERFRPNADMPCVGISFGVDRIHSITKARMAKGEKFSYITSNNPDVYVMAFGNDMTVQRIAITKALLDVGLKCEFTYKKKPKPQVQFKGAETAGAPLGVILGEEEQKNGQVRIKRLGVQDEEDRKKGGLLVTEGVLVQIEDVGKEAKSILDKIKLEEGLKGLSVADEAKVDAQTAS